MTEPRSQAPDDPGADDAPELPVRRRDGVWRWEAGRIEQSADNLAAEEPLEIRVRGRSISVTLRTPGCDEALAVGFLLSEGVIRDRGDVLRVEPCGRNADGNLIDVILAPSVAVDFARLTRHVFASSSCGLCGKATIQAVRGCFAPIEPGSEARPLFDPRTIAAMPDAMRKAQAAFTATGGLHAAALFDPHGTMLALREDVGRHNAVDKAIGHALMTGPWPLDRALLLVSGRTSFEIMQKALAARIPLVAAVSAPSSLAVDFAAENNQTLIGFLRPGRMNVYTHPGRLFSLDDLARRRDDSSLAARHK